MRSPKISASKSSLPVIAVYGDFVFRRLFKVLLKLPRQLGEVKKKRFLLIRSTTCMRGLYRPLATKQCVLPATYLPSIILCNKKVPSPLSFFSSPLITVSFTLNPAAGRCSLSPCLPICSGKTADRRQEAGGISQVAIVLGFARSQRSFEDRCTCWPSFFPPCEPIELRRR